jgi:transposase
MNHCAYLSGHLADPIVFPSEVNGRIILTVIERSVMAKAGEDPKVRALREARSLNPRPDAVRDEQFSGYEFLDARDLVQVKYEMVRRARVDGEPVSQTAAAFGFSRPSFYAAERALDDQGLQGLVPARPGPRGAHKLTAEVVSFARDQRGQDPKLSSAQLVELIAERFGVRVHRRSVERALARAEQTESEGDR